MSKMRYINTKFWSDPWVVDHLNPLDCHLFMYLLTNEHTNVAGVYEISLRTISFEIGLEKEEVSRMLKRLEPKVFYVDGWIVLANGIKNQNYKSPKIQTGIEMVLSLAPTKLGKFLNLPPDLPKHVYGMYTNSDGIIPEVDEAEIVEKETENTVKPQYGIQGVSHSNRDSNRDSNNIELDTNVSLPGLDLPKKNPVRISPKAINGLFAYWEQVIGYPVANTKKQREAASTILKEHESLDIAEHIKNLAMANKDKFGPRIADFQELKWRYNQIDAWINRNTKQVNGKVAKI